MVGWHGCMGQHEKTPHGAIWGVLAKFLGGLEMARRETDVTIDREGRDKGKKFRITEMSAYDAEDWALTALGEIARADSNIDIPENAGAEALAGVGLKMLLKIPREAQRELARRLMGCVRVVYDEKGNARELLEGDIEDPATLITLKIKCLELHLDNFF